MNLMDSEVFVPVIMMTDRISFVHVVVLLLMALMYCKEGSYSCLISPSESEAPAQRLVSSQSTSSCAGCLNTKWSSVCLLKWLYPADSSSPGKYLFYKQFRIDGKARITQLLDCVDFKSCFFFDLFSLFMCIMCSRTSQNKHWVQLYAY